MAITSTAKADAAKNFRMEVFDTSTTWTVPEGVTAVEVVAVGAGGGGGGGAGGAGNPLNLVTNADWGAGGGGGGGGAGHIQRALIGVTPGDTIPITIGAGGTGGKKLLESRVVNYVENPVFQSNTTGWSMSGGATFNRRLATDSTTFSLSGGQNTYPLHFAEVFIATNNTFNFSYDSGTGKTFDQDVFYSTFTGFQLKFGYNSQTTGTGLSTTNAVLAFLNGSTTLATFQASPVGNYFPFSQANSRTFAFLNFPTAIPPVSADRFIVSMIAGTGTNFSTPNQAVTMRFTEFMLVPRMFADFGRRGTSGGGYADPSLRGIGTGNSYQAFFWAGTPGDSRSLTTYVWGAPVEALNTWINLDNSRISSFGFNGKAGESGGNTLFGTQIVALGGGAGGGGRPVDTPPQYFIKPIDGFDPGRDGGNGGGAGSMASFNTQNNSSPQPYSAGGGGGTNGWLRVNSPAAFGISSTYEFSPSGNIGNQGRGVQGWGGGRTGGFSMGNLGIYSGSQSPVVGGFGESNYGWGGNGGHVGAPTVNAFNTAYYSFYTERNLDRFARWDAVNDFNLLSFQPNAKAGGGQFMTIALPAPHPSNGVGFDGEDGQNAIGYGGGGAGGNGGGSGGSIAFNTNKAGRGGFGGDGGDGTDGYMILMYWE
jgi:hypothetical protein